MAMFQTFKKCCMNFNNFNQPKQQLLQVGKVHKWTKPINKRKIKILIKIKVPCSNKKINKNPLAKKRIHQNKFLDNSWTLKSIFINQRNK